MDNLLILVGFILVLYFIYRKVSNRLQFNKDIIRLKILAGSATKTEYEAYYKRKAKETRPDTKVRIYSIWKNIKTDLALTKRWLTDSKYREQRRKKPSNFAFTSTQSSLTVMGNIGNITGEKKEKIPFAGISKPIEKLKEEADKDKYNNENKTNTKRGK